MTEHPNAKVVRELYASTGPAEAVARLFHDDAVWHLRGAQPMAGDHVGREAVLRAMAYFEGVRIDVHDVLANEEHAVALLHSSGERNGKRYESLEADVFHIRDGRIAEFWSFTEDTRVTDAFWASARRRP